MKRARLAAGGALLAAGAAAAALALREPAAARVGIDAARTDASVRVVLTGGHWDCGSAVPADAGLTADRSAFVPLAGERRTVLVAFAGVPPACDALPPEPAGVLAWMPEPAYEALRDHDPGRWATAPQSSLALLFPGARPARVRWPFAAAFASAVLGLALCVSARR